MPQWLQKPPLGTPLIEDHLQLEGLVGWWPMLEGNGDRIYNYGSAADADGTLTNIAFPATAASGWNPAGKFGETLTFDGTDDWVVTGLYPDPRLITVMSWFFYRDVPAATDQAFGSHDGSNRVYLGINNHATGDFYVGMGDTFYEATNHGMSADTWYHLAATGDGATCRIFLNGVEMASFGYSASAASTNVLRIGARNNAAATLIGGQQEDVRVYNVAKMEYQIQNIMLNPFAAFYRRTYASLFVAPAPGGLVLPIIAGLDIHDSVFGGQVINGG